MTLSPFDDRNVKDRPDLPAYELNTVCANPDCDRPATDDHHISRRSAGTKSFWVELSDGTVLPNRVGLCRECHADITGGVGGHRARIGNRCVWGDEDKRFRWHDLLFGGGLVGIEPSSILNPHPPFQPGDSFAESHVEHSDEETCATCKGTGKRQKPKSREKARNRVGYSVKVPKDEQENGYEIVDTLIKDGLKKLGKEDQPVYYGLVAMLTFFVLNFDPKVDA